MRTISILNELQQRNYKARSQCCQRFRLNLVGLPAIKALNIVITINKDEETITSRFLSFFQELDT